MGREGLIILSYHYYLVFLWSRAQPRNEYNRRDTMTWGEVSSP